MLAALCLGLLAPLCGCIYVSSSTSSSVADAHSITNRALAGDIPATLKSLDVDNRLGFVHIVAVNGDTPGWSWKLGVGAPTDALAAQAAMAADCKAVLEGDHLRLVVSLPDSLKDTRFQSDLEIRVPKSVSVHARNRFGETRIRGVGGDVEASGQNGAMDLRDIGGRVSAQNAFGRLTADNTGPATLKNQNGGVEAINIHGKVEAESAFGAMTFRDIDGAVELHNQNGRVEAARVKGDAKIHNSFGEVVAEDIDGKAELSTQNGAVHAARVKGDASITTSFGELHAEQILGDLTANNQNGRISVAGVTGAVRAGTHFGEIQVEGAGREFQCHDQNGAIRLRLTSPELKLVEAQTSFGSIEVTLPGGLKPAVAVHNNMGGIESDVPVLLPAQGRDPFADVPPGTPRVRLDNSNGHIRITTEKMAER
jgi:DUF4097 and DUF4098 domain-containing protein YvlB